ncbi:MAG: DUF1653 domain-containing protein [Anaerotignum sp.]|nr:DUF1653 domain-containing protein [Anaerotignum sp.]MBR6543361.1 DUF1653 domain-containing protein [Anaerotignum sp.]
MSVVIGGKYEHYKGKPYRVLAIARHSETLEEMVVYQQLYGEEGVWVRPLGMFQETVEVDGKVIPRFRHIEE